MNKHHLHVGYLIKVIDDKLQKKADMDLKKHDLTMMQSRVLAFLASKGGRATQKEVELILELTHFVSLPKWMSFAEIKFFLFSDSSKQCCPFSTDGKIRGSSDRVSSAVLFLSVDPSGL